MTTVVLTTGGTIASRRVGDGAVVAVDAGESLGSRAELDHGAVRVEELCRVGSYAMTLPLLARLGERVRRLCDEPEVDAVVVTHGTDTMEESAYLVDLGHRSRKPVVFTGAQLPADHPETDGPANLRDAVRLAQHPSVAGLGVLVAMAGTAYAAAEATKGHSTALDPWGVGGAQPVAVLSGGDVAVRRRVARPGVQLAVPEAAADRRVALVKLGVGMDGAMLRAAVSGGAEAVVLEAFGLGNAPPGVTTAVAEVVAGGVPVAVVSRCGAGPTAPVYGEGGGADLQRAGALLVSDLTGPKARILLVAALACSASAEEAVRLAGRVLAPVDVPGPSVSNREVNR